eukprot:4280076-Pyramimonas_sp.AAC.1
MKSWRFLILNWGGSEGFGGVLRGSDVRSRGRGSTDSVRVIICVIIIILSVIVHHRDRQIYDPAVKEKSGNTRKPVFQKRQILIRKR